MSAFGKWISRIELRAGNVLHLSNVQNKPG